jgi:hypothetical protein
MDIIFTLMDDGDWISKDYYPTPASKSIPEWYKKMSSFISKDSALDAFNSQTMKRCMPVFDSITFGYIIYSTVDVEILYDESGKQTVNWARGAVDGGVEVVTTHPPFQTHGYLGQESPFGKLKFFNPWSIQTPKGYSTLFISPMHRPPCGVRILEGVVDTDKYTNSVQFPFEVDKDFSGLIPAGTPIVQVIPFKRDSFKLIFGEKKEVKLANEVARKIKSVFINSYRNNFRTQKDYQ